MSARRKITLDELSIERTLYTIQEVVQPSSCITGLYNRYIMTNCTIVSTAYAYVLVFLLVQRGKKLLRCLFCPAPSQPGAPKEWVRVRPAVRLMIRRSVELRELCGQNDVRSQRVRIGV